MEGGLGGGGAENSFIRPKITTTWRQPGATHTHKHTHTQAHTHTCKIQVDPVADVSKTHRTGIDLQTDRWGCVNTTIESERSELSQIGHRRNLIADDGLPLTWPTCIPHNTPPAASYEPPSSVTLAVHCLYRKEHARTSFTYVQTETAAVCVCERRVWWVSRLHCRSGLEVRLVWRRVSGVRWGHSPPHAAEAVCH